MVTLLLQHCKKAGISKLQNKYLPCQISGSRLAPFWQWLPWTRSGQVAQLFHNLWECGSLSVAHPGRVWKWRHQRYGLWHMLHYRMHPLRYCLALTNLQGDLKKQIDIEFSFEKKSRSNKRLKVFLKFFQICTIQNKPTLLYICIHLHLRLIFKILLKTCQDN